MNSDMNIAIVPKSDQMNSDDLIGNSRTIRITSVEIKAGEQPVSIRFEGDNGKPYKPCKSMCRVLVAYWGADAKEYAGRSLTLMRDPTVKWGGMEVGGIRISHMSHIAKELTMALTVTRGNKKAFTVKPLDDAPAVDVGMFKKSGEESAKLGMGSLRAWWSAIGAANQKAVGGAQYLAELKTIAEQVDSEKTQGAENAE